MMVFLDGVLEVKEPGRVVMNVNGVGYEAAVSLNTFDRLPQEGARFRLLVVEVIREDAHPLFGFLSEAERETFLLLTSVSGIGPKLALAVLSGMSLRDLRAAVAQRDVKRLGGISGIGKKTAERIVLELKDKLGKGEMMEATGDAPLSPKDARLRDVAMALVTLGYKQAEAQKMVRDVADSVEPEEAFEDVLRRVLRR